MSGSGSRWPALGCATALTAAVTFPAGIWVATQFGRVETSAAGEPPTRVRATRRQSSGRDPYSPEILSDPYVLEQHRKLAEAMERGCRLTGQGCLEAAQARAYVERRPAR